MYPTAGQRQALEELLEIQRQLYNAALEERRGAWRWERRAVTRYDQYNGLTGAEEWCPELARFGRRVAQGTLDRLDEAFSHFLGRARAGKRAGFPRFKSRRRWDSVQWSNAGGSWKVAPTGKGSYGRLYVQGIGHVSIKLHRHFEDARPVKLVVQRRLRGWEATVVYRDVSVEALPPAGRMAGVDVGVSVLAAVADDHGAVELVENPAPLTRALHRLERAQQALAACRKGSNRRQRARRRVARLHEQVRQQRRQHAHQLSATNLRPLRRHRPRQPTRPRPLLLHNLRPHPPRRCQRRPSHPRCRHRPNHHHPTTTEHQARVGPPRRSLTGRGS